MNDDRADDLALAAFVEFDAKASITQGVHGILIDEFTLIDLDAPLLLEAFGDFLRGNGAEHPAVFAGFGFELDFEVLQTFGDFLGLGLEFFLTGFLGGVIAGEFLLGLFG